MKDEKVEAIIRKIKGLLATAEDNANEEEAQASFVLAQKLMLKYNIEKFELTKGDQVDIVQGQASTYKTLRWYERLLVSIVTNNFRVKSFYSGKKYNGRRRDAVVFYGLESDVQIAKEVYVLMADALEFYTKRFIDAYYFEQELERDRTHTTKLKNSYIHGFLYGLKKRLDSQRSVLEEEYGLVVLTPKIVEDSFNELSKDFQEANEVTLPSVEEIAAYMQGTIDGEKVDYTRASIDVEF